MRSVLAVSLVALGLLPGLARAQNTSAPGGVTPAAAAPAAQTAPFAAPPGMTVLLEIDARDSDLLGMVKDLLSGMNGEPSASTGAGPASFLGPMGMMQIDKILKDVTHLRLIQYQKLTGAQQPDNPVAEAAHADPVGYYEKQFVAAGGRRLLYSASGGRVAIIGFDAPRGMAFVYEDGKSVMVGRMEGRLDVKPLAMMFGVPTQTGEIKPAPARNSKPGSKPTSKTGVAKKPARR